jgi:hypothetical protein
MTEDRILDFLDGNLSSHEEEELLHRLAVSPERRTLLKQHLQVRELTSSLVRKHRYMVPKALTATLFETLASNGYAGPLFHQSGENADALRASLEKNLDKTAANLTSRRRFRNPVALFSSLGSFVAGALLVYLFLPGITSMTGTAPMASATGQQSRLDVTAPIGAASRTDATDRNGGSAIERIRSSRGSSDDHPRASSHNEAFASQASAGSSIIVNPSNTDFATVHDAGFDFGSLQLGTSRDGDNSANSVKNPELNVPKAAVFNKGQDITSRQSFQTNADLAEVTSRNWWDGDGIYTQNLSDIGSKTHFRYDPAEDNHDPIFRGTTASIRTGGGVVPGGGGAYSGSLIEMKISADLASWLVAKLSFGQFMPYETEALNAGMNYDGVRQLKLEQVLQHRSVVGAEMGIRFKVIGAPIEMMGGILSDLNNGIIPRASIFSHVMLSESLSLHMGAEAVLYQHDITSSIQNKQNIYSYEHPVMISSPKTKELAGFIGPALELAWHF